MNAKSGQTPPRSITRADVGAHRLVRWLVPVACAVAVLVNRYSTADDARAKRELPPPAPNRAWMLVQQAPNPVEVQQAIDQALPVWRNPPDESAEYEAVSVLFGQFDALRRYDPPERVKQLLVARGLRYRNRESRQEAAWAFQYLLEDDLATLIPLMCDALNDPQRNVRQQAVYSLEHAIRVLEIGPDHQEWDGKKTSHMKEHVRVHGDGYLDEIVELLVTKALTDEHQEVAECAIVALPSNDWATPNARRLRALNRVLAKGQVHRESRDTAEDLRDKWAELLAKQAAQQPANAQGAQPQPPGAGDVEEGIERALAVLRNPPNDEAELQAVYVLFGKPDDKQPILPPEKIAKLLVARGLDYKNWKSRYSAVRAFPYFLENDVPRLIVLLRDALNDPKWQVRLEAVCSLIQAMSVVASGPTAKHWTPEKKAQIGKDFKEHGQEYLDQMIDLMITKGLTDERRDVADLAHGALMSPFDDVKPNAIRLRALERVIAKRQVNFWCEDAVGELRDAWVDSMNRRAPAPNGGR